MLFSPLAVSVSGPTGSTRFAANELVERAVAAVGLVLLVDERQVALVERLEELVPRDRLQRAGTAREVDTQDARVVLAPGRFDLRRLRVVGFDPAPDLVVVGRRLRRRGHRLLP